MAVRPSRRSLLGRAEAADEPPAATLLRGDVVNKEWHVEYRPTRSVRGPEDKFSWRLRDKKRWFLMWTKQKDAWRKARECARIYGGRAFFHRKDGSVRAVIGRSEGETEE